MLAAFRKIPCSYIPCIKSSGFNKNLKFESIQTKPSRNRKRKVVWVNPPYNSEVKRNIDKLFETSPKTFPPVTPLQENI